MFKIGKHLSTEEYQTKIVPCIVKLFSSSDRNARFKLLTQIEHFVEHLSSKIGKYSLLHFVAFFHVASLFSTGVDNKKGGVDNEKALELTNSTVFHRGRQ